MVASAPTFDVVQAQVNRLLKGKILVGHALQNDLKVYMSSDGPVLILLLQTGSIFATSKAAYSRHSSLQTVQEAGGICC